MEESNCYTKKEEVSNLGQLNSEVNEHLHSILADLSKTERIAIYLKFWSNMNLDEISCFMNISRGRLDNLLISTIKNIKDSYFTETSSQERTSGFAIKVKRRAMEK